MSAEKCSNCRFWLADSTAPTLDEEPSAYGQCRRYPPKISDHMASIAFGTPNFGQQFDPEDLADAISINRSSLIPVTFFDEWCGEFSTRQSTVQP